MSMYHIIGGNGFVGHEISKTLDLKGIPYNIIGRNDQLPDNAELDKVIFCAGSGDCLNNSYDVFEANSNLLVKVLKTTTFNKMVYLSSTRIYMNNHSSEEFDDVIVGTKDNRRLFNLTKLVSEEMCLRSNKNVTIIRPSNIYGTALKSPLFLPSIIRDALKKGIVDMYVDKGYSKDYVSVGNVAKASLFFSEQSGITDNIINVASGVNISAAEIADILIEETGCKINWNSKVSVNEHFPVTSNKLLMDYIPGLKIDNVIEDMKGMISEFKESIQKGLL